MGQKLSKPFNTGRPPIAISKLEEAIDELRNEKNGKSGFVLEFKQLEELTENMFEKEKMKASKSQTNQGKNRYQDVLPCKKMLVSPKT